MAAIQIDANDSRHEWLFTITGLRDLIRRMAERGVTKVDLLDVDLEDIQNILMWMDLYFKVDTLKDLKQLKDTAQSPL